MNPTWIFLLEASIGTAVVWIIYYALFRNLTFFSWNRFYLLAGMFLSVSLPLLDIGLLFGNSVPVQGLIFSISPVERIANDSDTFLSGTLFRVVLYLYFSIVAARILIFGVGTILIMRKIRNAANQTFEGVKVYCHPDFKPASFFNKILLPAFDSENMAHQQILLHESEHVRQGHSWDLLFTHFVKSLLWINPFVYLIENALREVHEYQADNKVIQKSGVQLYGRLLVANLTNHQPNPLFNSFNQFQIKNRIVMMNKGKSTHVEKLKYFIGIPFLVIVLGIVSSNIAEPKEKVAGIGSDFEFNTVKGEDLNDQAMGNTKEYEEGVNAKIKTMPGYLGKFPWDKSAEDGC